MFARYSGSRWSSKDENTKGTLSFLGTNLILHLYLVGYLFLSNNTDVLLSYFFLYKQNPRSVVFIFIFILQDSFTRFISKTTFLFVNDIRSDCKAACPDIG